MIEIIPSGASAVVSESGSRHPDKWDLSTEMQRDLNQIRTQAEKEFIEVINQAERNSAADALADSKTQDAVADAKLSAAKTVYESMLRADGHSERSQKQVSDAATATVVGFKDAQSQAYQLSGESLLEAAKNAAALGVQATSNFNALSVQANLVQYQILLDSQKNAAAATLQAEKLAAVAAAKAAECCCELKTAIHAEGERTRDLINAREVADLREKLADAKARARHRTFAPVPVGTLTATDDD